MPLFLPQVLIQHLLTYRWAALLVCLLALGGGGCASDKNLVAHAFNNVAARDNAYFLARQKLQAIEEKLYVGRVNDYNQTLPLFPTLDSTSVRAGRADLNDIIKKASMPIQHRPGSDWTDDAYVLVGWARFYQMQFDDAALTFKYVNSTSKDPNAQHEALIGLMRTFVAREEFDNAKSVSDLLDKETGRPQDARQLFLTRADYYIRTGEPAKAIPQLEKAIPLIEFKNERSRTRYVLAQLYQNEGENKKAYDQLNQILARNPPYELDFFAKLMLGQVSDLSQQDKVRLDKYFAALLKDPKNKDYRDKIYYEMARLSYRETHFPEALKLLRQSIKATTTNRLQKSYTYLLAGRIYYEDLQKYRLAAAYYDSTVQNLNKEAKTYAAIKERSDILKDFAAQYTIIETQDSLQALAHLGKDSLDQRLNRYATAEMAAKKVEAARVALAQKAKARADEFAGRPASSASAFPSSSRPTAADPLAFDPTALAGAAKWYFDNPATLGTARADFVRRWGNRRLQDNWRTLNQAGVVPTSLAAGAAGASDAAPDALSKSNAEKEGPASPEAEQQALVSRYRKNLPLTDDLLRESDALVEGALYELAGIYKEQLKERDKGYATYDRQVTRYPRGQHAPDAYYLLYLHYKELGDAARTAQYAAALQREFPASIYAKLIADPLYREHELALRTAVSSRIDSAFAYYKNQEFRKATAVLARTEKLYPKNDQSDRVAYLRALLVARTQPPLTAQASVLKFAQDYPNSPLAPQAQALADAYKKQEAGTLAGALASTEKPVVSQFRPGEVENRMRIYYREDETPAKALNVPAPAPAAPVVPASPATVPPPAPTAPTSLAPAPTGSAGPRPAAPAPAGLTPATAPVLSPSSTPASAPASSLPAPTAAPTTAYTTDLNSAHAVVLVFPKDASAAADLTTRLATYNGRFFAAENLQVKTQPLGTAQNMFIVEALPTAKAARSYAVQLRGPQSPVARLRGAGYQTLVVSPANLALLQSTGDMAGYAAFYQRVYK